jgi:Protein of unknown function (DUF4012)
VWLSVLGLLALLLAAGLSAAFRYLPLVDDIRGLRGSAQAVADQVRALEPATLDGAAVAELRDGLTMLDARMDPVRAVVQDDPIVRVAALLPGLGTQIDAADDLVSAADALVQAGTIGLDVADQFVALRAANASDPEFAMMPAVVGLMAGSTDDVDRIAELVDEARGHLAAIPSGAVAQVLEARDLVAEPLDAYAPLLEQYREVDDVLPAMLGWGEPRRYLVLAQNPAELRPGGGYAGTVGILAFQDGALVEQSFQDVYELDLRPDLPFITPPTELANYLLGDDQSWRLADAVWSADFPTGARKAREFYALEGGEVGEAGIDGVIGITTFALDRLLEVVGSVDVDAYGVTVAPGDTTMTLLGETRGTETSTAGRKEILDVLARTVMQRLLALPADQWVPMADALLDIGTQKLAVAWFEDDAAERLVLEGGWGGEVCQGGGDYVYALEANMAPTSKYNLVVDREASFVAKLDDSGGSLDSLRLDWQNDAGEPGQPYAALRDFSNNEDGWYGAYLRLLVPSGSQLVTASGQASDDIRGSDVLADDTGRAVFGNYLFMPPGGSTLSYLWTVPDAATSDGEAWEYRLAVQKQPGARPEPWSFRVDLPAGAKVLETPTGALVEDGRVRFEAQLDRDLEFVVRYTLPAS